MDPCPNPAELADFLVGKLPRPRTAWIAEHVQLCSRCEAALQELDRGTDPLLAALGSTVRDDSVPERLLDLARGARKEAPPPTKLDRFEVLGEIGKGSYGTVYKARDPKLGRIVAIKMLRTGSLGGAEEVERFLREARSFAQLNHPGIVTLHEIGQDAGRYYLVEELVEGSTLADRLAKGAIPARESAEIVARVCDALQAAHQHGVIHRDLKPSNILLDANGLPHLADFGLAKFEGDDKPVTQSGEVLGTPAYMSPEQARGEGSRVDARTDVYSMGVILYELLTRERPFQAKGRMLLLQVLEDVPRAPRQLDEKIPRDLETICLKAMSKDATHRYASALELGEDLRRSLAGEAIRARPETSVERLVRWTRRRPAAAALIVVSLLAVALIAAQFSVSYANIHAALERETRAKDDLFKALVQNARLTSDALKEFNEYYTAEVVGRLTDRTIQVTHDYALKKNAIPLPATMSVELANRISQKGAGMKIRLYSDNPFPWRRAEGGPKDAFQEEALRRLRADPAQPFYRLEDLTGRRSLRYATASRMEKRCLDCHNKMTESPKRDWKEGDVVGVYEVSLPVEP
jgi:tRNA A-37 threonylcarbamoyl transferase component Bud32